MERRHVVHAGQRTRCFWGGLNGTVLMHHFKHFTHPGLLRSIPHSYSLWDIGNDQRDQQLTPQSIERERCAQATFRPTKTVSFRDRKHARRDLAKAKKPFQPKPLGHPSVFNQPRSAYHFKNPLPLSQNESFVRLFGFRGGFGRGTPCPVCPRTVLFWK